MEDNNFKAILCQAVIRQNYCDWGRQHNIIVLTHEMLSWLANEMEVGKKEVWEVIRKWEEDGILQLHPHCPVVYFPENADEPDVYIINPMFYDKNIKPFITTQPETYCI